ncbi:sulfurtransferase [Peptostreptococcus anaerobius]|uniref:sulfurtransferase n=1 Tax=Peptostreptococcus anaerobius TaxID=1261 RepID=UPI002900C9F0|nr:sulfurtransferase [Peptostreptococcus anaerobius]MDU1175900.1 sulfurtransferase [Peptostreptococcus anaerobius]MDU1234395.1 sulfurtransferase [Peptostreptococcus anaerobius]
MKRLISIDEFNEMKKKDDKIVIFDCRFDLMNKTYGVDSYSKGHIKGAYLMDIEHDLVDPVSEHGGRHPFKKPEDLKTVLENFGVDNDTTIITYDDGDMQGAARLVFQLNQLGIKRAFCLDGGFTAYKANGGEVETSPNTPVKSDKELDIKIDNSYFVDMDYVKSSLYKEGTLLIDSRSHNRYLGLEEPVDRVAGHIPSAKNYFFMDTMNLENIQDTSFKSDEFLKDHFKKLDDYKEIILYCGSGISLMVNALALDKLGIDYKVYPGSYSDWISYQDNDIMTGQE